MKEDGTTREPGGLSNLIEVRQKRLTGHVEEENIWKIRKCLVGEMTTICSVSSISNRLLKWGLGEIKVQRMGAKLFLLTIEDEDLYLMLEDLDWSYLKEIFSDIKPWSETMGCRERATWLEVSGLPLHCWNGTTLKKIAGLWGTFEAMGINANHSRDCEKVTVLISTRQVKKIDEVIEMEVRDKIFEVGVVELGFLDDSDTTVGKKGAEVNVICEEVQESESISDSKLEQENKEVVGDDRSCSGTEEEALNVMCAEKDLNKCMDRELENIRGQINVDELMGGISNKVKKTAVSKHMVGPGGISSQLPEPLSVNTYKKGRNLGSKIEAHSLKKSWASIVDAHFNSGEYNVENNSERCESLSEGENAKDLFEDLESWKGKERKKKN
ncbi:hypothetical protein V6N13_088427 [Hibiscus sabdariffa]